MTAVEVFGRRAGGRLMDIVIVDHVKKYFETGNRLVKAVDGVSLLVEKGKFTAIVGASGSGKTTLLNLIGGLYRPTGGRIIVDDTELSSLTEQELTIYRRRRVGFVFQDCSLVSELTVRENILFPLALDDSRPDPVFFERITGALRLDDVLDRYPHTLSAGTRQCAAIARALITRPSILLADEPTGSLDVRTSQNVAGLLKMTTEMFHQTLIMITHSMELAQLSDQVVRLQDGRIV